MRSQPIRRRKTLDDRALPVGRCIGLGVGGDAAEREDVLGLLLAEDVHGVVVGDDADEPAGGVDDRQGEQVVLVDLAGDGLLVLVDPAEDDVALHDVFDRGGPAREDQVLERDEADQPSIVVDDVAVVDRLAVGGLVAEPFEGLADGDVGRQRDVVGRHDRAGGSGLVAGQPADVFALGLGEVGEHDVHEILVEPVDQVGPLVVRHEVQELGGLDGEAWPRRSGSGCPGPGSSGPRRDRGAGGCGRGHRRPPRRGPRSALRCAPGADPR